MQELSKAIADFASSVDPQNEMPEGMEGAEKTFQLAAETWAVFCLRNFTDKLLTKGLGVSSAMIDFLDNIVAAREGNLL